MNATLAFAAATTLASPPILDNSTMTLLEMRLDRVSVATGRDANGRVTCRLSSSTGERRLDEKLCETAKRCAGQGDTSRTEITTCIDNRKPQMLSEMRRLIEAAR